MRESWELLIEDPIIHNGKNLKTGRFIKGHIPHNKGLKMPEKTYSKVSKTMFKKGNKSKRKYCPGTDKNSKRVEMLKNGIVIIGFVSITDASRKTGIERENIRAVVHGKRKRAGGYEWRMVENKQSEEIKIKHKELIEVR